MFLSFRRMMVCVFHSCKQNRFGAMTGTLFLDSLWIWLFRFGFFLCSCWVKNLTDRKDTLLVVIAFSQFVFSYMGLWCFYVGEIALYFKKCSLWIDDTVECRSFREVFERSETSASHLINYKVGSLFIFWLCSKHLMLKWPSRSVQKA